MSVVTRQPRAYEPIWKQLRNKEVCELQIAHKLFLPRIKKAIINEKYKDVGFKLINEVEDCKLVFEYDEGKKKLTVKLVQRYGLVEIVK